VIITTNLEFSKWVNVFYDEQMTAAMIDRLVHHSYLLLFDGQSYRMRIPMKSSTHSGGKRPLVPAQIVRPFRLKSSGCSDSNRPPVPDQRIQWFRQARSIRSERSDARHEIATLG